MQSVAEQIGELEKIFIMHPFRGDAVPSPAAAWLKHGFDVLDIKRWLDCDVTSADHAQALRQRDVVPDFRYLRWTATNPNAEQKTLGEAYCSGDVEIDNVIEALCNTKRGGVAIHVKRLRQAAAYYDNASCAAHAATSDFAESLRIQRCLHLPSSVATVLDRAEVKCVITEFQAAHKALVKAAQGLLDARKRYVLEEGDEILYCAELSASILLVNEAKHRFPGALRPFALALAAELNEVAE